MLRKPRPEQPSELGSHRVPDSAYHPLAGRLLRRNVGRGPLLLLPPEVPLVRILGSGGADAVAA